LVQAVARGESVDCHGGGKEVHASDVARAAEILLTAESVAGEVYNCYDRYSSQHEVASIAKQLSASHSEIRGVASAAKHQIVTQKLQRLGMTFGGRALLEYTIQQMLDAL
jgi:nucleoside-diphosphate-sugar epimerase